MIFPLFAVAMLPLTVLMMNQLKKCTMKFFNNKYGLPASFS